MILGRILIWLECLERLLELRHLSWIVTIQMTLNIVVGIVTRLQSGQLRNLWFNYQQGQESLLQSIQTISGAYPVSYLVDTGELSVGVEWLGLEANHSHFVPRLRIYGATPPLPPYTFMACIGTTLHLLCFDLKLVVRHFFVIFGMHGPLSVVTVNVFVYDGVDFKTCC